MWYISLKSLMIDDVRFTYGNAMVSALVVAVVVVEPLLLGMDVGDVCRWFGDWRVGSPCLLAMTQKVLEALDGSHDESVSAERRRR